MSRIYVGISGWTYPAWRGKFYPKKWVQKKELDYLSRQLNSVEVNGTFYGLQKPATFQQWYRQTPPNFVFSVKGGQYITHVRRLKDVLEPLATFLGSGLLCLQEKLGPILWQFPPNVMLKDSRFQDFFEALPHNSRAAANLAIEHGRKMEGRNWTDVTTDFPIRHAFEFRHPSFKNPEFIELMRKHGVAVVFSHGREKPPYIEDVTADFIYARMHGEGKEYKKGYPGPLLDSWVKRIQKWSQGSQPKDADCASPNPPSATPRDIYLYFGTDEKIYAPSDAKNLMSKLKLKWDFPDFPG